MEGPTTSSEAKKGETSKEQKENLILKEKLNRALNKLREIIGSLPAGSRARARAEHTLNSANDTLLILGKNGAPQGKYTVSIERYGENPQKSYTQNEGVPVDELIDILKNTAKELDKSLPTKASLDEMKKKVKDLDEEYKMAMEETDKSIKYSQWIKARSEYYAAQEKCDIGSSPQSKELKDLADSLLKNSEGYFKAHYTKEHGEGGPWTKEEQEKQDLRTKKEAKLVSLDYRATGSEEGDYKAAMEILKHRRELKFAEETETMAEPEPILEPEPITPEPVPLEPVITPEPIPITPEEKKKLVFKVVGAEITDFAKSQARDAGDAEMTMKAPENPEDLKGVKKFFKGEFWKRAGQKIWKHGLWRDFYRNKAIAKAREDVFGNQNVFSAEGKNKDAHDKFTRDVIEQFSSEYEEVIHKDAGETIFKNEEIENEKEVKVEIKKLIIEYASGRISKEAFKEEEARIFNNLKADTEGKKIQKKEEVIHASNLEAIAEEVKKAMEAGTFLEDEDFDIDLIYGKSKAGVRTEANFTRVERLAEKLSHTKIGQFVNETTIATSLSIVSAVGLKSSQSLTSFGAKILPFLGTALVSSGFAYLREGKKVEEERRQHAREIAQGKTFDPAKMERRKEIEESRYQTTPAQDLINKISEGREYLIKNETTLTPEILTQTLSALADVEAKIRLSDQKNIDFVSYTDSTKVVEERKNLDIEKAKMKVALRKLFEDGKFSSPSGENFEDYFESLAATQEGIVITGKDTKDRIFNKMKATRQKGSAKTALITGLVIGTTMQEIIALGTGQTGVFETGNTTGVNNFTALGQLRHYLEGKFSSADGTNVHQTLTEATTFYPPKGNLHEAFTGSNIKLPEGTSMTQNGDGSFNLLHGDKIIAEHITTNPDGTLAQESQNILCSKNVQVDSYPLNDSIQKNVTPEEYLKNHSEQTHEVHRSWMGNDTPMYKDPVTGKMVGADLNELKTHWGGENGTGINAEGKYVLNVSHMTPGGSFQDGLSVNAQELMKEGKLRMLLSLSKETQNQVFEVQIGTDGKIIVDPNTEIGKMFFANVDGHAKFMGRFAEMAEKIDENNNFRMLSTLEGPGINNLTDTVATTKVETILNIPENSPFGGITGISGLDNYSFPPFIPIVPRTPLEKLKTKEEIVPYYFGGSGFESNEDQKKQYEKERSETLKENPDATLDQFSEIDSYIQKQKKDYLKNLSLIAEEMGPINKECRLSVCIPVAGHQEGKNIYQTLKNFSSQTIDDNKFEIVLFVNRPEKNKEGKIIKPDSTLKEIGRFKKDYPNINIRVCERILPIENARIGYIRKTLNDAVLLRQFNRGKDAPEFLMVSNDADNKGVAPQYIENFISKFDSHKEVDSMVGQLDWDPKSYIRNPLIHIGTRLFQYEGAQSRAKGWHFNSSGANFAFRASVYAAVGGYSGNLPKGGEDTDFGAKVTLARSGAKEKKPIMYAGTRSSRLYTSSRRAEKVMTSGLAPIEQWDEGFSAFDDEVRKVDWENKGGKINYKNKKETEKLVSELEKVINRTIEKTKAWNGSADSPTLKRSFGWLGIKYEVTGSHSIKITDASKLLRGLEQYQKEGLEILERKTTQKEKTAKRGISGIVRKLNSKIKSKLKK